MKPMSEIGKEMLAFQERLAREYHYEPIEPNLFLGDVRKKYLGALPGWCKVDGDPDAMLYSLDGTLLSKRYIRVVIGDYGAFLECTPEQVCKENIQYKPWQEYRYQDERFSKNVKYFWLTAKDRSDCKIYFQKKAVDYADYMPGFFILVRMKFV